MRERGHVVRGTTRDPRRVPELESCGVEAVVADPDRVSTLAPALEHASAVCILLGSTSGERAALAELHGPRLEMLLLRTLDTTVRGVVYEASGAAPDDLLHSGASVVRRACEGSRIPFALLQVAPANGYARWLDEGVRALELVLGLD